MEADSLYGLASQLDLPVPITIGTNGAQLLRAAWRYTLATNRWERLPDLPYHIRTYIIEERKGQGAKPKTVKTASPPLSAPHKRLRRPFPPRRGEKTALGRFWGEKRPTRGNFTLVQL